MKSISKKIRIILLLLMAFIITIICGMVTPSLISEASTTSTYMDIPQITVLTHGLSSRASYWSNENGSGEVFAEDKDSLLFKLSQKAGGANIYRAYTDGGYNPTYTLYSGYSNTVSNINSVSKHIIIVFDSVNSSESNDFVYSEFKHMLNNIISKVKALNPYNKNPQVNLIGHSRGGITNLQYALDYPENVHSLISIGTPYSGSKMAKEFGEMLFGQSPGLSDIINEQVYDGYYQRWINGYESKYKNINSIAIGATTTIEYQISVLRELGGLYSNELAALLENYEKLNVDKPIFESLVYPQIIAQYPTLGDIMDSSELYSLVKLLDEQITLGELISDVFVPVDSQQGYGYKNFKFTRFIKRFNSSNASIEPKRAVNSTAIIHNLETYDPDIHNYILKNIVMKSGDIISNEISIIGGYSDDPGNVYSPIGYTIKIRNTYSTKRRYVYNMKMCFTDDAKNWTGLVDINFIDIESNETKLVNIEKNFNADSIAISSINGNTRNIIYGNNLNYTNWFLDMSINYTSRSINSNTKNGMKVNIVGKNGGTWLVDLTNNTGSGQTFYYNTKMCNEGDAKNWTGLSDLGQVYLANGATTSEPLRITENGWATSIAISYMDGNYRKIFYAKDLNVSGTMTAYGNIIDTTNASTECIAAGTMITLADGNQVPVENLTGNEMLLVWNLETGTYDVAPILFIDSDPMENYEVIKLTFSDDATVDVISEHGFWDVNLNEYVYLDEYAADYIGHSFLQQGEQGMTEVTLVDVDIVTEVTMAYSPVTYGHLCYYVNGMLSMPGGIDGLFNIFEVDRNTMMYDAEAMAADIEEYGLYTYEELSALVPVTEEMFDAVNAQYLKVAVGKGMITVEQIGRLIERYADMFA